jgi:hypothetical protein
MSQPPNSLRSLLLRLRNLPVETTQQILIELPLPQLLEVCSSMKSFNHYCQDRRFWFDRAKARYGTSANRFAVAETSTDQLHILPGLIAYLDILGFPAERVEGGYIEMSAQRDMTDQETADLTTAVMEVLQRRARAKQNNPLVYYAVNPTETRAGFLFPAASSEEAILSLYRYYQNHPDDPDAHIIQTTVYDELRSYIDEVKSHGVVQGALEPVSNLINILANAVIGTATDNQNGIINLTKYETMLPRSL